MTTPQDDLQQLYEEASAMEGAQPAPLVRVAVVAHAAMLAQSRIEATEQTHPARRAANWPHWKSGLVASVLLVPLFGVLVLRMQDAPETQDQVVVLPHSNAPVASKPAAEISPAPALPARAETSVAAAPPPPSAPAPLPALERPGMQGALGAAASAESRADRAATTVSRSREAAPLASNLAAAPPPANATPAAPAAASAKALASAGYAPPQSAQLLQAARDGDLQRVQALLTEGAPLNARDTQGRTALMLAAIGSHATLVRRLLELGADRAATDSSGLTALQHAQQRGFTEIVALLE